MGQFLLSVNSWFRQNGTALVRMMFALLCIGLVIAKYFKLDEVDFVSVILLILAALSFRPTMFESISRVVRRVSVAGMKFDLHDRDSTHIQEQFDAVQNIRVPPSEPVPPAPGATIAGEISEIVRTRKIVLHDGNTNEERARLFVAGNGAVNLQLCDSAGEQRAAMWVSQDGKGGFALNDNNGIARLFLSGDDLPLVFRDSKNVARGGLIIDENDEVYFTLMNNEGNISCVFTARTDGGVVRIHSTDRKSDAGLAAADGVSGVLYLRNKSTGGSTTMFGGRAAEIDKGESSG